MSQVKELIEVKAGEKVELFSRSFSSVPMNYEFDAEPVNNTNLRGKLEVHCKKSLGKKAVNISQLQRSNAVHASMWDTFVTIFVVAEEDLQVTFQKRKLGGLRVIVGLALLLVAVAAVIAFQSSS